MNLDKINKNICQVCEINYNVMQNINISVVKGLNCDYQMRKKNYIQRIQMEEFFTFVVSA